MSAGRTVLSMVVVLGAGVGSWVMIVSRPDDQKTVIRNLPESNPARLAESRRRNIMAMQALKDTVESSDDTAGGTSGSVK
ncbi:ubiquinol-cytochrome-c reductase complex assembly factor 3 [Solea solea]|uniref:ubiquinol-cytochrome-c reductase complex assembly factor 3 n=1 Tax=Solea solea TaxID=90069 RepID=UPI00272CA261|nr:ubiquinol-cytochrome-c reductase complex assembly factor 3 [Solea solea]